MAKGKEKHQARLSEIGLLGKDLARRAARKCELCEESGELHPWDSVPDADPDLDSLALLCGRCRNLTDGRLDDPRALRFLENAIWSQVPAVARAAKQGLELVDEDWARQALESLPD